MVKGKILNCVCILLSIMEGIKFFEIYNCVSNVFFVKGYVFVVILNVLKKNFF